MAPLLFPGRHSRSTTLARSSPATPLPLTNLSKPSEQLRAHCIRVVNKLQVLVLTNPRAMRNVERYIDELIADVS